MCTQGHVIQDRLVLEGICLYCLYYWCFLCFVGFVRLVGICGFFFLLLFLCFCVALSYFVGMRLTVSFTALCENGSRWD